MKSPYPALLGAPSSPLHPLYNPKLAFLRLESLVSRHLTQACIKFRPHVPAPASLGHLLANTKTTQVSHERYHDHVSLKAKPSFAFDETGYPSDERLSLGIEAILAPVECFKDS
jgi:hypothetical protein